MSGTYIDTNDSSRWQIRAGLATCISDTSRPTIFSFGTGPVRVFKSGSIYGKNGPETWKYGKQLSGTISRGRILFTDGEKVVNMWKRI